MKKCIIIFSILILFIGYLYAQEISVFQYSEPFGRLNLTLNNENTSSGRNYYFLLSYIGEDFQLYRSITLKINGRDYWLLFANTTQDWTGVSTETYKTGYLSNEVITALRNARTIEFTVDSVRWGRNDSFSLSNEALAAIKQFVR